MDLLFSLSFMPEKDKKNVVENINILMKHHEATSTNEDDATPDDNVDELLETDNEEDQISDTDEEITLKEPVVEPEVSVPDAEIQDAQVDLTSGILELKPTIRELRQVRVELQNTSLETISRLKRKWKNKNKSDDRRDTSPEKEEGTSGSARRNVVKCGKCHTLMPRSKLKSHKAEMHSKEQLKTVAATADNDSEKDVPGEVNDTETEKVVECHLCDDKFPRTEINSHLKTIHNTDVDYEAIMEQFNTMEEAAPGQRSPKRFKREKSPEKPARNVEEPLPLLELEFVPEQPPVRRELEKTPKVQTTKVLKVLKVYKKCETCLKSVDASSMEEHMVLYHVGKDFKCGLCYQIFSEKAQLKAHISAQHRHERELLNNRLEPDFSVSECKVVCSECGLKFITASSCDLHKATEHAKRGARRSDK